MRMIRIVADAAKTRDLDRALEEKLGLPPLELMEIAGAGALLLMRELAFRHGGVTVVAGPGQNGGDGFVVARYAAAAGLPTRVFALRPPVAGTPSQVQLDRLAGFRVPVVTGDDASLDQALRDRNDLVVDALFGTGLRFPIRPAAARWIEILDRARGRVVSIDLPSGLDGDSGEAPCGSVHAVCTLAIGTFKPGLLTPEGSRRAGRVDVVPLPYPADLVAGLPTLDT